MNTNTVKTKILCILPLVGHPRHAKRVEMLQQAGFEVTAIAFDRDYHKGKVPNCPVETLGKISHGRYLARALKIAKAMPKIRRAIKKSDFVYAFGVDLALTILVARLGVSKPVAVEVGDIGGIQLRSDWVGWINRRLIKRIVNACEFIAVTAPRFFDVYFKQWLDVSTPGMVIENKLESDFSEEFRPQLEKLKPLPGQPLVDRPLKIGYFGLLRDEWAWSVFEKLGQNYGAEVELLFRGIPFHTMSDLLERIQPYDNMTYDGEYKSPIDLPELYGNVDIVWACYDPIASGDWNKKWARPNRFYESCFFRRPLITRDGSQDSVDIKKHEIGFIVSEVDPAIAADKIMSIQSHELKRWRDNMQQLSKHVYAYTNEWEELSRAIIESINKSS